MLSYDEALKRVLHRSTPLPSENVPLAKAVGHVLATDIVSSIDVPPFRNSAMDGFALRYDDFVRYPRLKISGLVRAGDDGSVTIGSGESVRIMTGAPVPADADTVVPIEDCTVDGDDLVINQTLRRGQSIRPAGQDLAAGALALRAGQAITSAAIAMAAAVGYDEMPVHRQPIVGIVTTGDELVRPGTPLRPGQIYNSNGYAIAAQAEEAGARIRTIAHAVDDRDSLRSALDLCGGCDVLITTGGVSVGEFDYVKEVFAERGSVDFWQVAVRPGKPLAYGHWGDTVFFGLPGNPVSSMVTFELFVRPVLRTMLGCTDVTRPIVKAVLAETVNHASGRRSFLRARVDRTQSGYTARLSGGQDSGMLHAMVEANGLIVLREDVDSVDAGQEVDVLLFM